MSDMITEFVQYILQYIIPMLSYGTLLGGIVWAANAALQFKKPKIERNFRRTWGIVAFLSFVLIVALWTSLSLFTSCLCLPSDFEVIIPAESVG